MSERVRVSVCVARVCVCVCDVGSTEGVALHTFHQCMPYLSLITAGMIVFVYLC